MKWHWGSKDGGKDSNSYIWGLEWKEGISLLLMKFEGRSERKEFHEHAFNSWNWLLSGTLKETVCFPETSSIGFVVHNDYEHNVYYPSIFPIRVLKNRLHSVDDKELGSWVFSIRGKWEDTWNEYNPYTQEWTTLTHGRTKVEG